MRDTIKLKARKIILLGSLLVLISPVFAQSFLPTDDTDGQSDVAKGTNTTLNASLWCHFFLRFDLNSINETVSTAKLRVYQVNSVPAYTLNVNTTISDNWSEGGPKPTTGNLITSITSSAGAGYKEIDLTGYVQSRLKGSKILSVSITTDLGSWVPFFSRQNANNKPELVITTTTGQTFELNISAKNGYVLKNPDQVSYTKGTSVRLTAIPFGGCVFDGWSGTVNSSSNPLELTIQGNETINAGFTIQPTRTDTLLIDPEATKATVNLFNFMRSVYGRKMLTGCWTETQFGGNDKVESCSGKTPAIWGQDMNSWYSDRNSSLWNQTWQQNIAGFKTAWKRGQILQINWHWQMVAAKVNGNYTRDAWGKDSGGNVLMMTDQQWNDIVTPGTALYNAMLEDIDYHVTNFLKKIVDEKGNPIPIIFRPLHEIDGGWFWWTCKKDPSKTVKLYKILQDRIINYHKIHNLIWVWNNGIVNTNAPGIPFQTREYDFRKAFYVGDENCDLIGIDLYDYDPVNRGTYSNYGKTYRDAWNLMKVISAKKMIALCEGEGLPDPDKCFTDPNYAPWLYALPWYSDTYYDGITQKTVSLCQWNTIQFNSPFVVNAGTFGPLTSIKTLQSAGKSVTLSPNPSAIGLINIQLKGFDTNEVVNISIYDISGKLMVCFMNFKPETYSIDLSKFNNGLYIINVKSAMFDQSFKQVINSSK